MKEPKVKVEPWWRVILTIGGSMGVIATMVYGCAIAIQNSDREEHEKNVARDTAVEQSIPGCTIRSLGRYKRVESLIVVECPGKNAKTMNQWEWMGKYSKETATVRIEP